MTKQTAQATWIQNTNIARTNFINYKLDPSHTIELKLLKKRIQVIWNDTLVANSHNCIQMSEKNHAAMIYFPREDTYDELFSSSNKATYCPYKGDAAYWSLHTDTEEAENSVWSYPTPVHTLLPIMNYRAFYLDSMGATFSLKLNII